MEERKTKQVRPLSLRSGCPTHKRPHPRHATADYGKRPPWNKNFIYSSKEGVYMKESKEVTTKELDIPIPDYVCTHVKTYELNSAGEAVPAGDVILCKKPLVLAPWTGVSHPYKVTVRHTKVSNPNGSKQWTETLPNNYWLARVKDANKCPDNFFGDMPRCDTRGPPQPGQVVYSATQDFPPVEADLKKYMKHLTMKRGEQGYSIDW